MFSWIFFRLRSINLYLSLISSEYSWSENTGIGNSFVVPKISKSNQKNKNFRLKSFFHPLLGGQFSQQEFIKKCQDKFNILLKKYAN